MDDNDIQQLKDRVAKLESDQIQVTMTYNSDQNLFRSLQRTLMGNVNLGVGSFVMGTAPLADKSAMIEMKTTLQGFLPPRMTSTQRDAITSPAEGLIIYNLTTHKLNLRVAAAWEAITSV